MSGATEDSGGAVEGLEKAANRAKRALQEVKSQQEQAKQIDQSVKDVFLEYQQHMTRSFITTWCIYLLVLLVCLALMAAVADSTNQTVFKDGVLDRTLKVAALILPIITLVLGFYFGSPGKR
jgi:hypothetical protein